jgi:hydroxyacylglutathione hydrolase
MSAVVRRFYDAALAQASYLVGSSDTKTALVIDPNREVDQYVQAAAQEGLSISHVTETHIHADFVSGSRDLAAQTGAELLLSGEGGPDWTYAYARDARAMLLRDGDRFHVGSVRVEAMHTPGHTPEHMTFLVTDTSTAAEPFAAVTGDFIFVGDVGRPDLLERAAGISGTMEAGARALFRSLARFSRFPDYLQLWPGHGAGSACGKSLGSLPFTTLGYERLVNWALRPGDEDAFVRRVLEGQPEPPAYFAEMKRVNREGPPPRRTGPPPRLAPAQFARLAASGAFIVDTRHAGEYAAGHMPGTLNIPLNRAFTTWAGWLVPYAHEFYLIVDDRCTACLGEAIRGLNLIGLDRFAGYAGADAVEAWAAAGRDVARIRQIDPDTLARQLQDAAVEVVDVRSAAEWADGHIPGARHIPLGELRARAGSIPHTRPVVVHCQGGTRSAIAASVLRASLPDVLDMPAGLTGWTSAGHPVACRPGDAAPDAA